MVKRNICLIHGHKIKDLNRETIIGSFHEPDSHIGDKVKVLLVLSNYATNKKLDNAKSVDTSKLTVKKILLL